MQLIVAPSVALTVAVTDEVYQPFVPFGEDGLSLIVETDGIVTSRIRSSSSSAISRFQPAANACARLVPNGPGGPPETAQQQHTRLADGLAFARCMRARGFGSFPDPTNQGQLTTEMVTAAGIDLHQPELLRAGLACVPVTHGLLTRAAIERAVNGG
jgi:hypothetical protein